MDISFALTGKGYVIVAADTTAARSIVKMKVDEDKIKVLSPHLLMAFSGEPGDTVQFAEYIERNIRLYQIRNTYALRPPSAASWIRRALADSLRSRRPYAVNLLVGGYDTSTHTPHLYWIDYLGTMSEVPFAAHGYGAYFVLSLLDRYHDPEAPLEEGLATLRRCLDEVAKRLVVTPEKYKVKVVDKDGRCIGLLVYVPFIWPAAAMAWAAALRSKISTKTVTSSKIVPDDDPFRDPTKGDLTLRTSDGVVFHVYKCIVANASPVFSDMFCLPCSPDQSDNPSISVPEAGITWERLLRICHLLPADSTLSLDEIRTILDAGKKYQMGPVIARMRLILLQSSYVDKQALPTYAIACAYGLEDVALVAARGCLRLPANLGSAQELELISALQYTRLLDFKRLCGIAAAEVVDGKAWLMAHGDMLGPCSTCEGGTLGVQRKSGRSQKSAHDEGPLSDPPRVVGVPRSTFEEVAGRAAFGTGALPGVVGPGHRLGVWMQGVQAAYIRPGDEVRGRSGGSRREYYTWGGSGDLSAEAGQCR
ncbi:hypothetical protein ONZ51_g7970 [Trametes cubensis]|uniref:Probable proteasome subunit beta type-4 n=1 Tax=Trametes cubensis TaxID=1111947 RepID=A0AAD7X6Y2_9APHY|nr:hypothetical protein ONZ51_g7970 [Trametes cubensis]